MKGRCNIGESEVETHQDTRHTLNIVHFRATLKSQKKKKKKKKKGFLKKKKKKKNKKLNKNIKFFFYMKKLKIKKI